LRAHEEHRAKAQAKLKVAVFTVSSSRYEKSIRGERFVDESGEKAVSILKSLNHEVSYLGVVSDDVEMIRDKLLQALQEDHDIVLISGGTGLARRDVTIEAIKPFLEKEIEGFGEVLRVESYKKIGAAAALTRAAAGVFRGRIVMALPGSPDAVETALRIFGQELPHMVYIVRS